MSVLKDEYNKLLTRFNNGCKYLSEHKEEVKKWEKEIQKITEALDIKMAEIRFYENYEMTNEEIEKGFKDE